MSARLCFGLLLLVTVTLNAQGVSNTRFQMCGANLVNTMRVLCKGTYNKAFSKKSLEGVQMDDDGSLYWPAASSQEHDDFPQGLFRRVVSRQRRGIVDECCHRSCSLYELQQYCG